MNKKLQLSCLLVSSVVLIAGCNNSNTNSNVAASKNISTTGPISNVKTKTSLSGVVDFSSGFKTKATLAQVATSATVSLIYSSDASSHANETIASGLTDSTGSFSINPSASFTPANGDTFTLEAIKRRGGVGNDSIALRTIVKWNSSTSKFDSITTPSIYINDKTTSLAIITNLRPTDISSSATIGTMTVTTTTNVADINTPVTALLIGSVKTLVDTQLGNDIDPISTIEYSSGSYVIHTAPGPTPLPSSSTFTSGCVGEPSSGGGNCP